MVNADWDEFGYFRAIKDSENERNLDATKLINRK